MLRIPHATTLRRAIISVSGTASGIAALALTFMAWRLAGQQKKCIFYRKQPAKSQNMETAQSHVQTATLLLAPVLIKDQVKGHGGVTWEGDRGRGGVGGGGQRSGMKSRREEDP